MNNYIFYIILILFLTYLIVNFSLKEKYISSTKNRILLPVLYINLKRSPERNDQMIKQFKKYNIHNFHRIEGIDGKKIHIDKGSVDDITYKQVNLLSKINNISKKDIDYYSYHSDEYLSPGELGCLLSHLKAIRYAYLNSLGTVLILEDDASLELMEKWKYDIPSLIKNIPLDWKIIQLMHLKNINVNDLYKKGEIKWSCTGYLINSDGQKIICNELKNILEIKGRNFVADEYIYNIVKDFYVINLPYIVPDNTKLKSTIRTDDSSFIKLSKKISDIYDMQVKKVKSLPTDIQTILYFFDDYVRYPNIYKINDGYLMEYLSNGENKQIFLLPTYIKNIQYNIDYIHDNYNDCKILLYDFEPTDISSIKLKKQDILLTTKLDDKLLPPHKNMMYIPYYIFFIFEKELHEQNTKDKNTTNDNTINGKKFCCFAYTNCDEKYNGVKFRNEFYKRLDKIKKIDNLGKCLNDKNIDSKDRHLSNLDIFKRYKFIIAMENELIDGFISEKILNPILAGSIPIYHGPNDIDMHFNRSRIINVRDFQNIDDCIDFIIKVDNNNDLYESIISKSIFSYDFNKNEIEYNIKKFLADNI